MRYKEHDKVRVWVGTRDTGLHPDCWDETFYLIHRYWAYTKICNVIQKQQSMLKTRNVSDDKKFWWLFHNKYHIWIAPFCTNQSKQNMKQTQQKQHQKQQQKNNIKSTCLVILFKKIHERNSVSRICFCSSDLVLYCKNLKRNVMSLSTR